MSDLLTIDEDEFPDFASAWAYWREAHSHIAEPDFLDELPPDPEDDGFEDIHVDEDSDPNASWALLAQQLPNNDAITRLEDPERLGHRDLDRA